MKNLENSNQKNNQTEILLNDSFASNLSMPVYHEMKDKTFENVNLLENIQNQLEQIKDLNQRRIFLMKEISSLLR